MKRTEDMETQALLELYIKSAQGYIDARTARGANRYQGIGVRVTKELQRRGENRELLTLLSHPDPAVRLWAAIDSLGIEPSSAHQVLESLVETAIPRIAAHAKSALILPFAGGLPEPDA